MKDSDHVTSYSGSTRPDGNDEQISYLEKVLVGASPAIQRVRATIARVASSRLPVLIEGPTGSGKEIVATCLHALSCRSGALVAVNVSTIPHQMFESLMFGHVRGAFTSATSDHVGFIEQARAGTLFLDELEAFDVILQPKLLRATEDGSFRPVGAVRDRRSDCRIIVAINEPLAVLRATGRLRGDLLFRLAKLVIRLTPLRDRREDVPILARHFAQEVAGTDSRRFTEGALRRLATYDWPGNVRELRSTVEALVELSSDAEITEHDVKTALQQAQMLSTPTSISDVEQLIRALEACAWNVMPAAAQLGVHFSTVYRRMQKHGIPLRRNGGAL